jgi:hypothetical protein
MAYTIYTFHCKGDFRAGPIFSYIFCLSRHPSLQFCCSNTFHVVVSVSQLIKNFNQQANVESENALLL